MCIEHGLKLLISTCMIEMDTPLNYFKSITISSAKWKKNYRKENKVQAQWAKNVAQCLLLSKAIRHSVYPRMPKIDMCAPYKCAANVKDFQFHSLRCVNEVYAYKLLHDHVTLCISSHFFLSSCVEYFISIKKKKIC